MKRIKKSNAFKIIILIICTISFYLAVKIFFFSNFKQINSNQINDHFSNDYEIVKENSNLKSQEFYSQLNVSIKIPQFCEKFVILTTINKPTPNVKYMSDALYGWCLIVVGDRKTPPGWSYKNAFFLDLDDQSKLANKFKIVKMIPLNSYLRKMVGYLFAMANGAKYIYETDDDNAPFDGLFGFRYETFKGLEGNHENNDDCKTKFKNPYSYFGQPSVWPRGYPLEKISVDPGCLKNRRNLFFNLYDEKTIPIIQQGLVNGDPDVDAIYRLTRKNENLLNIEFDSQAPPIVLNKNEYAPINSQNTFYHTNSFFTLVFPLNVTFRECDILRGYIAIRLLNEINGRVSFMAPNAFQIRNSHSFHKDYLEEKRLYENIYTFVSDLDEWSCSKVTVQECFIDCIIMLIEKKHLNKIELNFYKAWIEDLESLGYQWPKINRKKIIKDATKKIYYKSIEKLHSSNSNENELSADSHQKNLRQLKALVQACNIKTGYEIKPCKFEAFILITKPSTLEDLNYVITLVNLHFPYIVLCLDDEMIELLLQNSTFDGLAILAQTNFTSCIDAAFNIGFKQQTFVIAENIRLLKFWSEFDIFLNDPIINPVDLRQIDSDTLRENVYFTRRTVANAVKLVKFSENSHDDNICSFYIRNAEQSVCKNFLNATDGLNWHKNDLPSESCENIVQAKIWIPEIHDGPRADIPSTLAHLGQISILAGYKFYKNPYPEIFKYATVMNKLSDTIGSNDAFIDLNDNSIKNNYEYYKNDADFKNTDFVICSFYASQCEAFIPLNKTIIFNPAHRYNLARCSKDRWKKLNSNLFALRQKSKLIVSAMSMYDTEYLFHFTGLFGKRIFAYGGFYAKDVKYNPIEKDILFGPTNQNSAEVLNIMASLNELASKKEFNISFKHIRNLYKKYTLQQLANHPAIVLYPYAVMSYSIIDYYIAKIPIFVPSSKLWKGVGDRSIRASYYCGNVQDIEPSINTIHPYSPNEEEDEAYQYWLKYADYYQWPYVTVFESDEDLLNKLNTLDLRKISENMQDFNKIREADLLSNWCDILKKKDKDSKIPDTYQESLSYFNTQEFQV